MFSHGYIFFIYRASRWICDSRDHMISQILQGFKLYVAEHTVVKPISIFLKLADDGRWWTDGLFKHLPSIMPAFFQMVSHGTLPDGCFLSIVV